MKKYDVQIAVIVLMVLLVIGKAYAQQVPQFTQLNQSRYILNPAATGESTNSTAIAGFRKQWVGMDLSPTTFYVGYNKGFNKEVKQKHEPLAIRTARVEDYSFEQSEAHKSKITHGVGAYMIGDNYGAFKNLSLNISYALHYSLSKNLNFSAGLNSRFHNSKFDASSAQVENSGDAAYENFVAQRKGLLSIEFDFGSYVYGENYFVGYSTNQLTRDIIVFQDLSANNYRTHHSIIAGYKINVNDNFSIQPSTIVKSVKGAPLSMDVLVNTEFKKLINLGLGYRSQDALMLMAGVKLDEKYSIFYSYDFNTSSMNKFNSGSHEITLKAIF